MYIPKTKTLAGRPVAISVRVTIGTGTVEAYTYYRSLGDTAYTKKQMELSDGVYTAWIPGEETSNGVEYYISVEKDSSEVATLPKSNPTSSPLSLSAESLLEEVVDSSKESLVEFAVGLSVKVPIGALNSSTNVQVTAPTQPPEPPPGIQTTPVQHSLSMASGQSSFSKPVTLQFRYSPNQVSSPSTSRVRAYYYNRPTSTYRLMRGNHNRSRRSYQFNTSHFSDFFLGEGAEIYPAAVTAATTGVPLLIKVSVVNDVPLASGTLHYRVGDGQWKSVVMVKEGDYHQASIPSSDITTDGLSYYIEGSDGENEESSQTFSVNVVQGATQPTVVTDISDTVAQEDSNFSYQVPANTFGDLDVGDILTYTATLENGDPLPGWIGFNPNNRTFSGRPGDSQVGNLVVRVTATDSTQLSISDTFEITVNNINDAPVLDGLPEIILDEGESLHGTGTDLLSYVGDVDSNIADMEFRITNMDSIDSRFGVTIGMSTDSSDFMSRADNTIHIHPVTDFYGMTNISVEARDSEGATSPPQTFSLKINPVGRETQLSYHLYGGWNIVSFPMQLEENGISLFLSKVPEAQSLWSWQDKYWRSYVVGTPVFLNQLQDLEVGKGYYVYMPEGVDKTVQLDGAVSLASLKLQPGWNLVGFTEQITDIQGFLTENGAQSIWGYRNGDWESFVDGIGEDLNDLKPPLNLGVGYFLNITDY